MSRRVSCIPSGDKGFAEAAHAALNGIGGRVDDEDLSVILAGLLRPRFPAIEVHRQELLARAFDDDVWYAYRDGKALGSAEPR